MSHENRTMTRERWTQSRWFYRWRTQVLNLLEQERIEHKIRTYRSLFLTISYFAIVLTQGWAKNAILSLSILALQIFIIVYFWNEQEWATWWIQRKKPSSSDPKPRDSPISEP